jgi:hypothetical protein
MVLLQIEYLVKAYTIVRTELSIMNAHGPFPLIPRLYEPILTF